MFEIYSIGDASYLTSVLNAVAMLSGTGDIRQLAGIGFLIGLIFAVMQGLMTGGRLLPIHSIFIAWIVYMVMFTPTTRVSIQDVYTDSVRTVDNVPLGPAVVGSLMSQVGFKVTRLMEQAFSTPSMTEYGFADPLQTLMQVRKGTLSRMELGRANSPTQGADMERSWANYISECTLYDVRIDRRSIDEVMSATTWQEAYGSILRAPTTEIWIGGQPQTLKCADAWDRLSAYTERYFAPALQRSLQARLLLPSPGDVSTKVQTSLDALAESSVDAQQYMVMAALLPFFEKGQAEVHKEFQDWDGAAMVMQAVQQRNAQWAAEETLFSRIVHPMMAFFEALLFAISPLMVFVIGLGPMGLKMIGKYLLIGLWIQLWMPVLAIVNLFVQMAISQKLDALQNAAIGDVQLPSIFAMYKMDFLLQDYLATGGLLASSTPAISLMLIYGSAITATHLAGRLQGGDFIDEKLTSPNIGNPAPALSLSPIKNYAPLTGTTTPQANSVLWTANVGSSIESSVRSSEQRLDQASERFSSSLSNMAALTASRNNESFDSHAMSWSYGATGSATDRVLMQEGEALTRTHAASGMSATQMAGVLGATLGGGRKGVGNISGKLQSDYSVREGLSDQIANDIQHRATEDEGFEARLAQAVKADAESGVRNVFSERLSSEESSRLSQEAGDVVSASRAYEHADQMQQRFGTLGSYGAAEMGHAISSDPALMNRMHHEIDNRRLTGDHERLLSSWSYAENLTPDQADAAAGMALLMGQVQPTYRNFSPEEARDAKEAGYSILSDTFGVSGPGGIDPNRHAGVGSGLEFGAARADVGSANINDPRTAATALVPQIDEHGYLTTQRFGPGAVDGYYGHARDVIGDAGTQFRTEVRGEQRGELAAQIEERAMLPQSAPEKVHHYVGGLAVQSSESGSLAIAGISGIGGAAERAFDQSLDSGGSFSEATGSAVASVGTGAGWSEGREAMIEARMGEVQRYGLTPAQTELYRQSTEAAFGFLPDQERDAARQAVVEESGPLGGHVAELIERSASSRDDTDLHLVGAYNRSAEVPERDDRDASMFRDPPSFQAIPPLHDHSAVRGIYGEMLDLIARPESRGNYDAWFGNVDQHEVDLSGMSVKEVRELQQDLLASGNGGSAMGRYQILPDTLDRLIREMDLTGVEKFSDQLQDRMGLFLAREAGANDWAAGRISDGEFAQNLAKVWAGLPKDESNLSHYHEDGVNRAQVGYRYVVDSLKSIRKGS